MRPIIRCSNNAVVLLDIKAPVVKQQVFLTAKAQVKEKLGGSV
jgi:hypothetical protein